MITMASRDMILEGAYTFRPGQVVLAYLLICKRNATHCLRWHLSECVRACLCICVRVCVCVFDSLSASLVDRTTTV